MNKHNGTSIIDWEHYEKEARKMTDDQLDYVIEDATNAMRNAPEVAHFPCKAQGFYQDEVHVYTMERERRKGKVTATQKVKILEKRIEELEQQVFFLENPMSF
jgi:hypothetical protein